MKKNWKMLGIFLALSLFISCANTIGPDNTTIPGKDLISNPGGIEIPLANTDNIKYRYIDINRVNKGTNDSFFINASNTKDNKVIDYFVTPGETYTYTIKYFDGEDHIHHKEEITVMATTGIGELTYAQKPVAEYDSKTSTLNFTTLPSIPEVQDRFIRNNIKYTLNYSFSLRDIEKNSWIAQPYISNSIDLASVLSDQNKTNYFGKKLYISDFNIGTTLNDIYYAATIPINNFSIPQSIIVNDTRLSLTVEASNEGNKIIIPKVSLNNLSRYQISRYDENGEVTLPFNTEDISKTELIDYFVETGKKYIYKLEYIDPNWNKIKETKKSIPIEAIGGVGDLIMSNVNFEYNEQTGIMQFTTLPQIKEQLNKINAKNKNPRVSYVFSTSNGQSWLWAYLDFDSNSIDLVGTLFDQGNDYEAFLKNELNFERVDFDPIIDNVCFNKQISKDKLIANNCTVFDQPIKLPDTRTQTKVSLDDKGINISLVELPTNSKEIKIDRLDVATNNIEVGYIQLSSKQNKTKIIDYFVTPNSQYKYRITYHLDNKTVSTKYSDPITPTNGISQLTFNNNSTVIYNPITTIMTFNPKPDFSQQLETLRNYGINIIDDDFDIFLSYSLQNNNNDSVEGKLNKATGAINWNNELSQNEWTTRFYDQDLILNNIKITSNIDDVIFNTRLSREALIGNIEGFPVNININDLRPRTKVSDEKGIKIELEEIPSNCNHIEIERNNVKTGKKEWMYMVIKDMTKKNITDYFVSPDREYQYKVQYYEIGDRWNLLKQTTYNEPISSKNGVGELIFKNKLSASYDPDTTVMTFNEKPDFSNQIEKLKSYNLIPNNIDITISLDYGVEEGAIWGNLNSNSKSINWSETLAHGDWQKNHYNEEIPFERLDIYTTINEIDYATRINAEDITNIADIPAKIFVKDLRNQQVF